MANNQTEAPTTTIKVEMLEENSNPEFENDINPFENVWVKLEVMENEEVKIPDDEDTETKKPNLKRKNEKKSCKKSEPHTKHLKCDQCDYRTGNKQCMAMHVLTHSDEKPYTCSKCIFKTKYSVALKHHMNAKHGGSKKLLKCSICSYTTNYKWNLEFHKKTHDPSKQYKCPECDYTTAYKHNVKKHSLIHANKNEGSSYYCNKCPFVSKYEGLMTRHLAKVHLEVSENAFKCEYCPFSSKTKYVVNKHKRNSLQKKYPVYCLKCDYQTMYRCALREHKQSHLVETKPVLENTNINDNKDLEAKICEKPNNEIICDIKIKNQTEKKEEAKVNDEPNGIICELKSKNQEQDTNQYVFDPSSEVALSSIQVIETPNKERPYQCTVCNFTAKFKAGIQKHYQRIHTQNRPYKCIHCDFSTKTKEQIVDHNKRSQTKEQTCLICGFTSALKCQFTMHGKEHHPFKCSDCEYTCKKKADLVNHVAVVHLGKRWICRHCDFKANSKESFLNHEAKHTGEKPFQCEHCDYSSARKVLVNNHMKKVHKTSMVMKVIDGFKIESLKKKTEKTEVFIINSTMSD